MIDFACKRFDINEIVKCALNLTKSECKVFNFFLENVDKRYTTQDLCKKLKLNLNTVQKAVKKLSDKKIILRLQLNMLKGGYTYIYETNNKETIRMIIAEIIDNWVKKVKENLGEI
jgi:predicted transcriptional regulator